MSVCQCVSCVYLCVCYYNKVLWYFRKWRFNPQLRESFLEKLTRYKLQQGQQARFTWFIPLSNDDVFFDQQLQPAGQYTRQHLARLGRGRKATRILNGSRLCTMGRPGVEHLFRRYGTFKLRLLHRKNFQLVGLPYYHCLLYHLIGQNSTSNITAPISMLVPDILCLDLTLPLTTSVKAVKAVRVLTLTLFK